MSKLIKSIVVGIVDPRRKAQLALAKAVAIARKNRARVTLFNAFMVPPPPTHAVSSRDVVKSAIAERLAQLQKLTRKLAREGIKATCVVEWDFPTHEAIVRYALKARPDLLVAESHHHNPLARMFLANTDWELIRNCPCPLWFVRSRALPKKLKVLVAVDPRHTHAKPAKLDDRLLHEARRVSDQLGGDVSIVHVYQSLVSGAALMEPIRLPLSFSRAREFDAATRNALEQLATRHRIKPSNRILLTGDAVHALPEIAAKSKSELLVMGAVSRSRLKQPFIGNTAEKVIDRVDCDVLVVKPANFKTTIKKTKARLR